MTTYSDYSATASATTFSFAAPDLPAMRLFLLAPVTVFAARTNMAVATYPLDTLIFDTVTTGAYTDIVVGMTLLLGSTAGEDDLGRTRVRGNPTSTTIPVGRSSRGTRDGELDVADDMYITVINDFRVWAKIPFIDTDGNQYKDSDLVVSDRTTNEPPVANAGVPAMGTISATTGKFRTWIPHEANTSFAVADGATITGYQWFLPSGVTLVAGSADTDSAIQVDCDPGFYWIPLTVTDSNANTHTARTWIFARDPDADACINTYEIVSHRWMRQGQLISIRVLEDIPVTTYPDGTLVAIMDGEPSSTTDRTNILFWGWQQTDPAEIGATRTGTLAGTVLECVDVAGRLDSLPGFSLVVYNDTKRDATANPDITWAYMTTPHVDKLLHYLLQWHSTALDLADWTWSGTTSTFPFTVLEAGGESIFDQVNRKCQALMPDHYLVCNRLGQMRVKVDPLLQDAADRTATVQNTVDVGHWAQIRYTAQRPPRVHWLEGSAIIADADTVTAVFCKAPGQAPGQGEAIQTHGEQLSLSQTQLNAITGHRYARLNARQSHFQITAIGFSYGLLDPAAMTWVNVTLSAAVAAQRGAPFLLARGLVHEIVSRYEHTRTGTVRTAELLWERETEGTPAVTVVPADAEPVDDGNEPFTPPITSPDFPFVDPPTGYLLWSGDHIMRTMDIMASPPTWELVDTGVTGDIYSAEYVMVDSATVGVWLLTSDGVWFCADMLAVSPSWSLKLSLAAMQADNPVTSDPSGNPIVFKAMATYGADPAYCIVATGPNNTSSVSSFEYPYTMFGHTHDTGATWTWVDAGFTVTASSLEAGFSRCGVYGITMFRSSPVVISFRATPSLQDQSKIIYSEDGGHTWGDGFGPVEGLSTDGTGDFSQGAGILRPYPSIDDVTYLIRGNPSGAEFCHFYYNNTGNFNANFNEPGAPSGYEGAEYGKRPNGRTFEPSHAIVLWRHDSTDNTHILETENRGGTWTFLYDTGAANGPINTPNGWPPDIDMWWIVRTASAGGVTEFTSSPIRFTDDRFATVVDKQGNLFTLLSGTWTGPTGTRSIGFGDGFALPNLGT